MNELILNGQEITINDVINVARNNFKVALGDKARESVQKASLYVNKLVEDNKIVYGITTGFGVFANKTISKEDTSKLQHNLLKSHACGIGEPLSKEIVKAMMLLRVNSLIKGNSGIRLEVIELMLKLLNENIIPYVYSQGSLGSSGDLVPLAHMALPLIGEGEVYYRDKIVPTMEVFDILNIKPITLVAKEGLALINGTQAMTAIGCITLYDASELFKVSNVALSLSLQALRGIKDAFSPLISNIRPYFGFKLANEHVLEMIEGSTYVTRQGELRVQDAYSLRCAPQVHGASIDALRHVKEIIEIEINAVTDNPLLFVDENEVISGGNFHGQPVALAMDYMSIAISELANISERRIERLINPNLNGGLPAFLVENGGLNSGFMIVQYSAASLVSENKVLSHPASVDSIPSSANQEDHVSMGTIGARKARTIYEHTKKVIAMELLCAFQALDFIKGYKLGEKSQVIYDLFRKKIGFIHNDETMYKYIEESIRLVDEIISELNHRGWLKIC